MPTLTGLLHTSPFAELQCRRALFMAQLQTFCTRGLRTCKFWVRANIAYRFLDTTINVNDNHECILSKNTVAFKETRFFSQTPLDNETKIETSRVSRHDRNIATRSLDLSYSRTGLRCKHYENDKSLWLFYVAESNLLCSSSHWHQSNGMAAV